MLRTIPFVGHGPVRRCELMEGDEEIYRAQVDYAGNLDVIAAFGRFEPVGETHLSAWGPLIVMAARHEVILQPMMQRARIAMELVDQRLCSACGIVVGSDRFPHCISDKQDQTKSVR